MSNSSVNSVEINNHNNHGDAEETKQKAEKFKEEANKFFKGGFNYTSCSK